MTTTTHDERLSDMMDSGGNGPRHYFGQLHIDDWDAAWPKGSRPVPFDPSLHTSDQRRVFVTLEIICRTKTGASYSLNQAEIASGSKHRVTLKSLEALGIQSRSQLRALSGRWVEATRTSTGQTYIAKQASQDGSIKAGDQVPEQALTIVALFDTEDAARAAEAAFYAPRTSQQNGQPARTTPSPADSHAIDQIARATLLATLPMLWQVAQKQPDPRAAFTGMLEGNPGYARAGITMQSPEVVDLVDPDDIPF